MIKDHPRSLKSLQKKIGVESDGVFGPTTMKVAMVFYKLTPIQASPLLKKSIVEQIVTIINYY